MRITPPSNPRNTYIHGMSEAHTCTTPATVTTTLATVIATDAAVGLVRPSSAAFMMIVI